MFGFGMDMFGPPRIPFHKEYKCYSVSMMPGHERQDVENGGKIILPPSALDHLTRLNTAYPMLFKLTNSKKNRMTHCGVLEFVADEGRCYIPHWMMRNLLLEEGSIVKVQSVSLPVAVFSKFEPQSSQFLDITNPKAVLENALRNFACLTVGDIVAIRYNDRIYEMRVLETKPGNAVSIIECDMEVDFAPAPDYVEPTRQQPEEMEVPDESLVADGAHGNFRVFGGSGNRLDGKAAEVIHPNVNGGQVRRGIPDYDYKVGQIQFFRNRLPAVNPKASKDENGFKAFEGNGMPLRPPPVSSLPVPVIATTTTQNQIIPFNPENLGGNIPANENPSLSPSSFATTPLVDIDDIDDDIIDDDDYMEGASYNFYDWQPMTLPTSMSIPLPAPPPPSTMESNSVTSQQLVINNPEQPANQDDDLRDVI